MTKQHPQHPEVRRDNATGTIVMRDGWDFTYSWLVLWATVDEGGARRTDDQVATWPTLNQGFYSPEWAEEQRRGRRALQRENGRLSAKIGQARAELARARERRRAAERDPEVEAPGTTYWVGDWSAPGRVRQVDKEEYERHTAARMTGPTIADQIAKGIHDATSPPQPPQPERVSYHPFGTRCYSTPSGAMVHVKSHCRCRERRRLWGLL